MTTLDADIRYLISNKDYFYGLFLSQMNRRIEPDASKCPTAAIQIKESGATLIINPDFWAAHTLEERQDFLKHEVGHFILNHITLAHELMTKQNHTLFNVAADLAVNSLIPTFPNHVTVNGQKSETATVANFRKMYPKIEDGKSFFWYLNFLQLNGFAEQQGGGDGDGKYEFDDHSKWGSGDKIPRDVADQISKQMVKNAVDETNQVGSLDGLAPELRDLLKKLLKPHNNWVRELRRFPQDAETVSLESTRKRVNRRYGTAYPGYKKERKVRLGVGFDVSGSMWDDETVTRLMHELSIIHKDAELYVMFFDTGITKEMEFEKLLTIKQIPGGGGTLFQPVLNRAKELRLDGLIMLTDGMNFDTLTRPNFPVLWGILEEYEFKAPFGRVITIPKPEGKAG